ncbi:hypothetical protein GCM10028794_04560 [Silanimonas algicola]
MLFRSFAPLFAALVLTACASAPKPTVEGIRTDRPMALVKDETYAKAERFVDADAVLAARSVGLPRVRIAEGAAGEGITPEQAALVANRAARDTCVQLARRYRIEPASPDLEIEIVVTAIAPTSSGAAGASALIGVFVPGPFRLPAGLGGFAADGAVRADREEVVVLRWAEGAGAITEDAKVSRIGDAYQLAGDFADDLARALNDPSGDQGDTRAPLEADEREAGEAQCVARFGRASVAGRGASILLPLSPESIDAGAPDANDADPVKAG